MTWSKSSTDTSAEAAVCDDAAARQRYQQDAATVGGDPQLLAALLCDPARLATEVLAQWYGREVTVEIVDRSVRLLRDDSRYPVTAFGREHHSPRLAVLLRCGDDALAQHRNTRMRVEDDTVGVAFSIVLLDRVTPQERATLTTTDAALGRVLRAAGIRRRTLAMRIPSDDGCRHASECHTIAVQALLCRDDTPVAYVQEKFFSGSRRPDGA